MRVGIFVFLKPRKSFGEKLLIPCRITELESYTAFAKLGGFPTNLLFWISKSGNEIMIFSIFIFF